MAFRDSTSCLFFENFLVKIYFLNYVKLKLTCSAKHSNNFACQELFVFLQDYGGDSLLLSGTMKEKQYFFSKLQTICI